MFKYFLSLVLALVLIPLIALVANQVAASRQPPIPLSVTPIWIPLLNPPEINTDWVGGASSEVWQGTYPKQYDQTQFKLCGLVKGSGTITLAYADEGDPYSVSSEEYTPMCYSTYVGYGSLGANPVPMGVYLTGTATIRNAQIFVGQER